MARSERLPLNHLSVGTTIHGFWLSPCSHLRALLRWRVLGREGFFRAESIPLGEKVLA